VLKTQDENYVRTMRAAGLKKIDKLKAQLTADASLRAPEVIEALTEEDLEALRGAGVLPGPSKPGKSVAKRKPKHIVFAQDETEARQYAVQMKRVKISRDDDSTVIKAGAGEGSDLGWKSPDGKKNKRGGKDEKHGEEDSKKNEKGDDVEMATANRARLFKEMSARVHRDRMLQYAGRELEMQRQLMGKGRTRGKAARLEEEGEGGAGAQRYKPRVFRWRAERKR